MSAKIIPFPERPPLPPPNKALLLLRMSGLDFSNENCTDSIHYFLDNGRCLCGKAVWPGK